MSGNLRNVAILEELRSQQESAWHKGSPVPVEALVSNAGSPLTDPQLLELIYAEVMLRENSGESCDSDEYVKRFPRLELPLKKLFAVHQRLADSGGVQSFAATDQPSAALPAGDSLAAHEGVSTFKTEKPSAENRIEGSGTIIASQVESHGAVPVAGLTLGPYRLLEKLGEGGMGAVYKAHHEHLGKTVALKILSQKIVDLPDAVSRFKREMKAVGMLHHPNIVQAHDAGQFHDVHFLAMEYIEGTDLQKLVQNGGPLPVSQACDLIRQSCMALEAAHSKGLIHRDIKPANLLLTNSGQIKLLDLGLALLGDGTGQKTELTGDGQAFGTPDYMSPEQWDDAHSTDARTDLYALGCTLYFLLVGHAPYATDKHRTTASKMKAHVTGPIPDFPAGRTDIPRGLVIVYRRLLAKNPSGRIQSAKELAEVLLPFTKPYKGQDLQGKVLNTRRGLAFLLVACGILLLGGLGLMTDAGRATWNRLTDDHQLGSEVSTPKIAGARNPTPTTTTTKSQWNGWPSNAPKPAIAPYGEPQARQFQNAWEYYLEKPVDYTNESLMKFRLIPPGEFDMGAPITDKDAQDVERPQHHVSITQPFYLGTYEVTQSQFFAIMGTNPSHDFSDIADAPQSGQNQVNSKGGSQAGKPPSANRESSSQASPPTRDPTSQAKISRGGESGKIGSQVAVAANRVRNELRNHPVNNVTWAEAAEFCERLSRKEKRRYRLPTEAEWEYVCRAGTTTRFPTGDDTASVSRIALPAARENARQGPNPVGVYAANPWGLYDMTGNVREWCADWFGPYSAASAINPIGPSSGKTRTVRGGDYYYRLEDARSSTRFGLEDGRTLNRGFRVVLEIQTQSASATRVPASKSKTDSSNKGQ